ncbi:MAG: YidC/Oxa1 family membrane protein insertase [Ruminococcaceae bacterium]|nr:YidC/Oxa1 family membrane protein insertase [Oscillospiraceae bacterium]
MDFISEPFGVIMNFFYRYVAFENYGLSIILFTLLTRIILFPLTLKQQKSMAMTQDLQPKLKEISDNYGDDREKLSMEQQKLYQKYGVNPMAGCLPMLIQFPLIIAIYQIVRNPLQYISGLSSDVILKLGQAWQTAQGIAADKLYKAADAVDQLAVNSHFLSASSETLAANGVSAGDFINMDFLGIFNLGATPWQALKNVFDGDFALAALILIPILATGTTYLSQWITTGMKKKKKEVQDSTQQATNTMLKLMPLMTLYFAFVLPAALGFYWFIGNLLSLLQTIIMNKFFVKKKEG